MTTVNVRVDHLAIARSYAAAPCEWPVAPRFSPMRRWCSQLADHPDYQVWLVTWLPGQGVGAHEHEGGGALYVLRGELAEESFAPADAGGLHCTTRNLGPGSGLHFPGPYRHTVINRSARPAVSVHVHGPV